MRRWASRLAAASRPSEIAAAAREHSPEAVALSAAVVPEAVDPARRWLDELRHVTLEIDGEDLLAAGVPEGPEVGRALAGALTRKLENEVAGRDAELGAALAAIGRESRRAIAIEQRDGWCRVAKAASLSRPG